MSWRREQTNDQFFRLAKAEGYRARSAYKLMEICEKFQLVRPKQLVLDLGAAPGSWSQLAIERVGPEGRVVAIDLQPMAPILGVETMVGDVREEATRAEILQKLGGLADVVLSDMAPQATGIAITDQARAIELAETALDIATKTLRPGGSLVVKVFRGEDFDKFIGSARRHFANVNVAIPHATRAESREVYVVARGFGFPRPVVKPAAKPKETKPKKATHRRLRK